MKMIDRVILVALVVGLWALVLSDIFTPKTATAIEAYEIDGLKRAIKRVVENCSVEGSVSGSVNGTVYIYSLPYGDIDGGTFEGTLNYATISC